MGISARGPSTVAPLTDLPATLKRKVLLSLNLSLDLSKGAFALDPALQRAWFLLFLVMPRITARGPSIYTPHLFLDRLSCGRDSDSPYAMSLTLYPGLQEAKCSSKCSMDCCFLRLPSTAAPSPSQLWELRGKFLLSKITLIHHLRLRK